MKNYHTPNCDNVKHLMKQGKTVDWEFNSLGEESQATMEKFYPNFDYSTAVIGNCKATGGKKSRRKTSKKSHRKSSKK